MHITFVEPLVKQQIDFGLLKITFSHTAQSADSTLDSQETYGLP